MAQNSTGYCGPFIITLIVTVIGWIVTIDRFTKIKNKIHTREIILAVCSSSIHLYLIYELCKHKLHALAWLLFLNKILYGIQFMITVFNTDKLIRSKTDNTRPIDMHNMRVCPTLKNPKCENGKWLHRHRGSMCCVDDTAIPLRKGIGTCDKLFASNKYNVRCPT